MTFFSCTSDFFLKSLPKKKCPKIPLFRTKPRKWRNRWGCRARFVPRLCHPGKPSTTSTAATDSWVWELLRANSQINDFNKVKSPIFVARYWHLFLDYILTGKKNQTDQGNSIKLHLFSLYKFVFIITQFSQWYLQPMPIFHLSCVVTPTLKVKNHSSITLDPETKVTNLQHNLFLFFA